MKAPQQLEGTNQEQNNNNNTNYNLQEESDKPCLLCVLIDLSTSFLDRLERFLPKDNSGNRDLLEASALQTFLYELIAFLNLVLISNFSNRIAVFVYNERDVQVVYEDTSFSAAGTASLWTEERQERSSRLGSQILKNVADFIDSSSSFAGVVEIETLFSAALSFALCYLHRRMQSEKHDARILCFHASTDVPRQYIGVMNGIFCAQRCSILIDVCDLNEEENSSLLQNAAYLTGGIYFKPQQSESIPLLNYLCDLYFPNRDARKYFHFPVMPIVDNSALCFESGEKIQIGYVCSVCLATFGRKRASCRICGYALE